MEFIVNSVKDKINGAHVIGKNLYDALEEILTLNGYVELSETDWLVHDFEVDEKAIVADGLEV